MIYLSVGTFPEGFDRLVKIIDNICKNKKIDCFAQIGHSKYIPNNIRYIRFLSNYEHLQYLKKSNLVIIHGGMGVISESINLKKKFIVFPRTKKEAAHNQEIAINILKKKINICVSKNEKDLKNQILKNFKSRLIVDFNIKKSNIPSLIKKYIQKIDINE